MEESELTDFQVAVAEVFFGLRESRQYFFGRAEARDFADVYVLARRFGKGELLAQAVGIDPGFDKQVLAQMLSTLDRFGDDELPAEPADVPFIRAFFAEWAEQLARR